MKYIKEKENCHKTTLYESYQLQLTSQQSGHPPKKQKCLNEHIPSHLDKTVPDIVLPKPKPNVPM